MKEDTQPKEEQKLQNLNKDQINIVTKFAFATRVGMIPNNPYKEN